MIYNIHSLQQARLIENGLDNDDALIIRAITGMYASAKMEHIILNEDRYIWVNQSYLQKQIPIVGSKRTIMRRINKMIDKGFLKSHTSNEKKGQRGTFYFVKPTAKLDELRDIGQYKVPQEGYNKMSKGGCNKVSKGGKSKCDTKDTINNKDNKEYSSADAKPSIPYKEIIEYLNKKANRQFNYKARKNRSLIKARVNEGYTEKDFYKVIDVKVKDWLGNPTMEQYLRPSTLFSNKFDQYLNESATTPTVSQSSSNMPVFK